jgi:hypothetical protein
MVNEVAARRFDDANALLAPVAGRHQIVPCRSGSLSSSRIFSTQCTTSIIRAQWLVSVELLGAPPVTAFELLVGFIGQRRIYEACRVHPRQRADPVPAGFWPERLDERELHVGPSADILDQQFVILRIVQLVENLVTLRIERTNRPS